MSKRKGSYRNYRRQRKYPGRAYFSGGKGKAKVGGQYVMSSSQRGHLRVGGYYGRYANGGELKFHDVDVDDASITQAGTIQNTGSINLIAQGVTESTRVGRKCTIKSILWRYNITVPSIGGGNVATGDTLRLIMYLDKQANGATIVATDLLESDNYQSFNNLSNSGRFRIICDKTMDCNITAAAGDGAVNDTAPLSLSGTLFKKCAIPLEFSSTTGAITELRSNNIGIACWSKTGALLALDSKIRLRFSDGG